MNGLVDKGPLNDCWMVLSTGSGCEVGVWGDVFAAMASSLPRGGTKSVSKQRNEQILNNNNPNAFCAETGSREGCTVSGTPAVNSHFLSEKQTSKNIAGRLSTGQSHKRNGTYGQEGPMDGEDQPRTWATVHHHHQQLCVLGIQVNLQSSEPHFHKLLVEIRCVYSGEFYGD